MRERARHHGGRLSIASQLGQGSLFQLRIPLALDCFRPGP
jgi:signal transduction histidine kinase